MRDRARRVGPVLASSGAAEAVITAICLENERVVVEDRGSYLRVLAAERCRVTRASIERSLGAPFRLPGDLELVMLSFKGRLTMNGDEAIWEAGP
jgi:hypothetical protein